MLLVYSSQKQDALTFIVTITEALQMGSLSVCTCRQNFKQIGQNVPYAYVKKKHTKTHLLYKQHCNINAVKQKNFYHFFF